MGIVESLPPRPLTAKELMDLNRSDALELASPIEEEGDASGVILATDSWVKGLAYDETGAGWAVVETVSLADRERIDGLQACEAAILDVRGESVGDADDEGDAGGADDGTEADASSVE
jgi:hypothetical protein